MLWLDVFLGFLLGVLLIFLLVRVTVDILLSRIRVPGGEVGWLSSFRDCSGRFWFLPAKRDTGTAAGELVGLHDGGVISVVRLLGSSGYRPDDPAWGEAARTLNAARVTGRAQAGEPSGLSLISAAG
jgi:hypothetical protein